MAIRSLRVLSTYLGRGATRRPAANVNQTLRITLAPKSDVTPSDKPPVRIYLGTESAQFRAERAFVWSIERVRDPARTYEIHLMKDLAGFERRLWLTGFTNYRFAIPDLAGREGRAIYNDADQIYLRDPAELFDLPMGDKGVLSINDRDTSVMLIDCERMAEMWNDESARNTKNRDLESRMRAAELWGAIDGGWNARDAEYDPHRSHLIHYTTIHTQPWRPQPRDYVYGANPASGIWNRIEGEADAAGFELFTAAAPTSGFTDIKDEELETPSATGRRADWRRLIADVAAVSGEPDGCYVGLEQPSGLATALGVDSGRLAQMRPTDLADRSATTAADVVLVDGLAAFPDLDMPWLLDALLARARRAVAVTVHLDERAERSAPADPDWWYQQLAAAGRRFPDRHWRLIVVQANRLRPDTVFRWSGGRLLREQPRTWVLQHFKTGHRSQAEGLADALDWPHDAKQIKGATPGLLAALAAARVGLGTFGALRDLKSPWPEVVIASGWAPTLVARWIQRHSRAATRLILLGRRGGRVGEAEDVAVVCQHFNLPPHPRQIETVLPPCKAQADRLASARQRWPDLYPDASGPKVAFLVGGDSAIHALDAETAASFGADIQSQVDTAGGGLAVLTSRRTRSAAADALRNSLGREACFVPWGNYTDADNPYLGYLASADIVVVTGESESMLAEAVATEKPVYIAPLPPQGRVGLRRRLADWVVRQANTDRYNARGSKRPQQGLQYLCARIVDRRWLLPRRDTYALHNALIEAGVARMIDTELVAWQPPPWQETERLAGRIRALLVNAETAPEAGSDADSTTRLATNG
ncbi:hypothetical protein HKX42_07630 [Salinisphaera sp. USBA-960]|nr:hypothetical protein [Salifodinibacter halophilus]NNC26741.1 hypothetical protein [Salifodinibacter halophilus]